MIHCNRLSYTEVVGMVGFCLRQIFRKISVFSRFFPFGNGRLLRTKMWKIFSAKFPIIQSVLVYVTTVGVYLLGSTPREALCFSNAAASEVLDSIQLGNESGIVNVFEKLQKTNNSFSENLKFLNSLIEEINEQYKLSLTVTDACRLVRENLHQMQIPLELQEIVLMTIEQIEGESSFKPTFLPEISSLALKAKMDVFGRSMYWPWEWNWFGLNKKKHISNKHFNSTVCLQSRELELPPKMAAGFACMLGGALLCILPGGQGVGMTLVGAGVGLSMDGIASGERPYYIDSSTGQKIP